MTWQYENPKAPVIAIVVLDGSRSRAIGTWTGETYGWSIGGLPRRRVECWQPAPEVPPPPKGDQW